MDTKRILERVKNGSLSQSEALAILSHPKGVKGYEILFNKAHAAGLTAGNACQPGGVCGFAWVHIPDGRSSCAHWLTKTNRGSKGYPRGVDIWVSYFGQSLERKEAYARAFAQVLRNYGIKCYSQSRMD